MVASVTAVLSRFKTEWATQLQPEAIIGACEEAGHTSWRDRVLTPVTTTNHVKVSWLLRKWHEVRQSAGCMAWDLAAVGSHHASPVCIGINILIVQEVIRWFRTLP